MGCGSRWIRLTGGDTTVRGIDLFAFPVVDSTEFNKSLHSSLSGGEGGTADAVCEGGCPSRVGADSTEFNKSLHSSLSGGEGGTADAVCEGGGPSRVGAGARGAGGAAR
jgi:hypothetical protein